MVYFAGFIVCAAIIFFAGKKLSFYGDLLAIKSGLSRGWVGIILMASITSLPELMVGVSASAIVQSADLATGDILGSCAFNLGILAMLDAFIPKNQPLTTVASPQHMLNAGLTVILISFVGFALFLPDEIAVTPWIGLSSVVFIAVFIFSVRMIDRNERRQLSTVVPPDEKQRITLSLRQLIGRYILVGFVIIVTALAIPFFAEKIAAITGLGKSFTGTFFLAVSTSLPEIAVSIAAVRIGSVDLAVGNLLGSNLFNILILALDDIFYTKGLLLKDASEFHMLSVLSIIIMSSVVIIGMSYRAKGKRYLLAWDAVTIFIVYILNLMLLYHFTR